MVSRNKKYRLNNGAPYKIYDVNYLQCYVHGAYIAEDKLWKVIQHSIDGKSIFAPSFDLVEINECEGLNIDDPVWVRMNNNTIWAKRHFSGISSGGSPMTFPDGKSLWTQRSKNECDMSVWDRCIPGSIREEDLPI